MRQTVYRSDAGRLPSSQRFAAPPVVKVNVERGVERKLSRVFVAPFVTCDFLGFPLAIAGLEPSQSSICAGIKSPFRFTVLATLFVRLETAKATDDSCSLECST